MTMRPTSLIRSDSDVPQFSAPAENIKRDALDCGINLIPCCLPRWFHRFATINWFLLFFVVLGIVQGSSQAYFAATVGHISEIFGYSQDVIDWLLISHDLFMGVLALAVAYWGNKIHRPAWMGGVACFQGVSCLLIFIPYLEYRNISTNGGNGTAVLKDPTSNLCVEDESVIYSYNLELVDEEYIFDWVTLLVMFVAQFFVGLGNASFFSHGFSYIDDNVEQNDSVIYIAIGLAVRLSTIQFGSFMAWSLLSQEKSWWIGYCVNASLLIFAGTMVALFPKRLMKTVIKETAETILEVTGRRSIDRFLNTKVEEKSFFPSLKRVFFNKVVALNSFAVLATLTATFNFAWYEARFMESQFHLPSVGVGFADPWRSRLWKSVSRPPIVCLAILASGLVLARTRPRARSLAAWNVVAALAAACLYLSYGFIDCKKTPIAGAYNSHLTTPYCSFECNCDEPRVRFEPVCTQDMHKTYYSPCHAGCGEALYMNDVKVYGNCSCVSPYNQINKISTIAMQGACDNQQCQIHWIVFQSLTVLCAAVLGSGFLGSFLINLRAVSRIDKALVIGYQFALIGIHVHFPAKHIYKAIADATCQYYDERLDRCNLHSARFGDYVSVATACFLALSAALHALVALFARDVSLFEEAETYPSTTPRSRQPPVEPRAAGRSAFSTPSTVELESLRPLRPAIRTGASTSGRSTSVNSIEYNRGSSIEPRQLKVASSRDEAQRSVVDELKRLTGTQV